MSVPSYAAAQRDHAEIAACRRLWADVVLNAYNDWWHEARKAKDAEAVARVRQSALLYFRSRDGETVLALAGISADPEHLADVAVDLTALDRTKKLLRARE